jgi:hypothetical protein
MSDPRGAVVQRSDGADSRAQEPKKAQVGADAQDARGGPQGAPIEVMTLDSQAKEWDAEQRSLVFATERALVRRGAPERWCGRPGRVQVDGALQGPRSP